MIAALATQLPDPVAEGPCSALPDVGLELDIGLALETIDSAAERLAEHSAARKARLDSHVHDRNAARAIVARVAKAAHAAGGILRAACDGEWAPFGGSGRYPEPSLAGAVAAVREIADACCARHAALVVEHGTASQLRQEASRMRAEARAMERALKRIEARWSR